MKTALVTGASSGVGKETAKKLLEEGYTVYVAARRVDKEDTTIDDARYQFEVNLFGLARLTQLALPYMRKANAGKIVNISSMGGKMYTPRGAWYHASKHALEGCSDCLRIELAQFGIDVIIVEPDAIATEFGEVILEPMLRRSGQGPYWQDGQAPDVHPEVLWRSRLRPSDHEPGQVSGGSDMNATQSIDAGSRNVEEGIREREAGVGGNL